MAASRLSCISVLAVAVGCAHGETLSDEKVAVLSVDSSEGGRGGAALSGGMGNGGLPTSAGHGSVSGGASNGGSNATAAGGAQSVATGGTGGVAQDAGGAVDAGPDGEVDASTPDATTTCPSGQKLCGGVCTVPAPRTGCDPTDCTPCSSSAPAHGFVDCVSHQCSFSCLSGYTKQGDACVGSTGAGGASTGCDAAKCTCAPFLGTPCCTASGACSCSTVPGLCF